MTRPRKYRKGEKITDIAELTRLIFAGQYVMEWDKPQHPGWMKSRMLIDLNGSLMRGAFFRAELNSPLLWEKTEC